MAAPATPTAAAAMAARLSHRARQLVASDLCQRFLHSPGTVAAFVLFLAVCAAALFAPWLAPHDTFDVSTLHLENAFRPPVRDGVHLRLPDTVHAPIGRHPEIAG